jgi:four helix bundle protein
MSKQILKSGTSTGANVAEAQSGQSKKDFLSKMSISLKEAKETEFWLMLLKDSGYLNNYNKYDGVMNKNKEIIGVLTKIIKTTKINLDK